VRLFARVLVTGIAVALVAPVVPAGADDLHGRRDQAEAQQSQVQSQLNLALASDTRIEAEVSRLSAEAAHQQNVLEDTQRAEAAATAQVTAATRGLNDATRRLDRSRRHLQDLALRAYMRPREVVAARGASGINELARSHALLIVAAGNQSELVDAYRQDQQDQREASAGLQTAVTEARAGTKAAANQAARLAQAQQAQQAAHAELQKRIADLRAESNDLAAQEKGIEALIAAQEAAAQAALTRITTSGAVTQHRSAAGLIWPIHGPVTSEYGPRWGGFHPGIDIAPPYGTPIHAAKDGVVIFAAWNGGYGNFVLIDHGGGLVTGYAHQSQIAVTQGQTVNQGQVIGYEGSTGDSTGPHLHFEVRVSGSPQNPRNYEGGSP
jgi:murein DD-endopeptidase MepM/ murein hydrolase activator NlpD